MLTVYTPGPANHQNGLKKPAVDGGIYLIKDGQPIDEPAQMRLIKNDPQYNEHFPAGGRVVRAHPRGQATGDRSSRWPTTARFHRICPMERRLD